MYYTQYSEYQAALARSYCMLVESACLMHEPADHEQQIDRMVCSQCVFNIGY